MLLRRLRNPLCRAVQAPSRLVPRVGLCSRLFSESTLRSKESKEAFVEEMEEVGAGGNKWEGKISLEDYHFDEVEMKSMLAAEEERLASYGGVQVISSTGVRAVEFCRPDKGNFFTASVINNLTKKIEDFESNWIANAIFLGSRSLFFFSKGVHESDFLDKDSGRELDRSIQLCASRIYDFPEHMISLYGGYISGTPFGMLLGCHYRLGTPSLLLCLEEFRRGQIPLGCLALQFARYSTIAPIVLKYLAVSGATLHSNELYELGVLTHLTDHKPHRGLQYGDTILKNDTQAVQPAQGEPEYLSDMIDDMDINADIDIHSHEAWDQFLTVPVAVPEADPLEPTNIKLIFDEMAPCFEGVETLEDCLKLLVEKRKQYASDSEERAWVDKALANAVHCSPLALKCWFRLVDEAQDAAETFRSMSEEGSNHSAQDCSDFWKRKHADMLSLEVSINETLRQHQLSGKWENRNKTEKESFDLSYYEDDPPEEVDLLEKKTLREQREEEEKREKEKIEIAKKLDADIDSFLGAVDSVSDDEVTKAFATTKE